MKVKAPNTITILGEKYNEGKTYEVPKGTGLFLINKYKFEEVIKDGGN